MQIKDEKTIRIIEGIIGVSLAGSGGLYLYQNPVSVGLKAYVNNRPLTQQTIIDPSIDTLTLVATLKNIFGVDISPIPNLANIAFPWSYTNKTITFYETTTKTTLGVANTGNSSSAKFDVDFSEIPSKFTLPLQPKYNFVALFGNAQSNGIDINIILPPREPIITPSIYTSQKADNHSALNDYFKS